MPAAQSTLGRLRACLRKAVWRIHERVHADRYRPSFGRPNLQEILTAHGGAAGFVGSVDEYALHLRRRTRPAFLFDETLFSDPVRQGSVKRWIDQAGRYAESATRIGLPLFVHRSAPLDAEYPWRAPAELPRDVLLDAHPHRFAFLPRLVLAILGGSYTCKALLAVLSGWMNFAARDPGLAYISTFVVTQRLIAVTCALQFLRALPMDATGEADLRMSLVQIAAQDIEYLLPRIGSSFPNGHLLTDRFAGWFAASQYPELVGGRLELSDVEQGFWTELERQTYVDGTSFEHAVHYHGLATEMALLYLLISRRNDREVDGARFQRIRSMLAFQSCLSGPDGNPPMIGDSIEDPMFPLDDAAVGTAAALREAFRALCDPRPRSVRDDHPAHERAFWLLAGKVAPPASPNDWATVPGDYPQGGVFVFAEADDSTRLVFRSGPGFGATHMPGHMHADLLSLCFVRGGTPLLVDPGTFRYRNELVTTRAGRHNVRRYLSGPRAHSGIVIDEIDPLGATEADFREGPIESTVDHPVMLRGVDLAWVEARIRSNHSYDGVVRGVVHVPGRYVVVYDRVGDVAASRNVFVPLQFDRAVSVRTGPGSCLEAWVGSQFGCEIVYSAGLARTSMNAGGTESLSGWISPRYDELCAAPQVLLRHEAGMEATAMVFGLDPAQRVTSVSIESATDRSGLVMSVVQGESRDLLLLNRRPAPMRHGDTQLDGRLLWVREEAQEVEVRGLSVSAFCVDGASIAVRYDTAQPEVRRVLSRGVVMNAAGKGGQEVGQPV